uniref:Methyltransferase type 12 n=1 Tax=Solibacter usitatus (strain Ellin6076) TaxID=234267 RepID=Q02AC8_SOLUE
MSRDLTPSPLLVQVADLLPPGRALDLACGTGRNARYLAALGWQVTAVDSDPFAIAALHAASPSVDVRIADLERHEFAIEPAAYDLICDFYYLQRDLFPEIRNGIRPGGLFAGTILLTGSYALESGELRTLFAGWKILYYSESPDPSHLRPSASILARHA